LDEPQVAERQQLVEAERGLAPQQTAPAGDSRDDDDAGDDPPCCANRLGGGIERQEQKREDRAEQPHQGDDSPSVRLVDARVGVLLAAAQRAESAQQIAPDVRPVAPGHHLWIGMCITRLKSISQSAQPTRGAVPEVGPIAFPLRSRPAEARLLPLTTRAGRTPAASRSDYGASA
jgi:hypothetical protein